MMRVNGLCYPSPRKRRVTLGEKCAHGDGYKCRNCLYLPEPIPFRDKYSDYVVTSKMISDIAFHASYVNQIVRQVPSDCYPALNVEVPWQLNENPQRVSFGRKVNRGDPYRYKEPLSSAEAEESLNTTDPLSWLSWSILIDIKLFGHETAFSRIPQPQDL
jgi:hypothetical protein